MKRFLVAVAVALGCTGIISACDTSHPLPASDIVVGRNGDGGPNDRDVCATPGHEGCPCSEKGAQVECGKLAARSGEYVTCSMGKSTCDGTSWGACTGNRIVAASLPGLGLGMGGLHPQATSGPCTDPCDPYTCTTVTGSTTDVTDPGVIHTDAGLAIQIGTQPSGPSCYGLFCQRQGCTGVGVTTTITGTVYDPAMKNPLYNAFVYIPVDPAAPLPAFTDGASCDTCAGAGTLTVVALDQTGADGKFTLTNVPVGSNIPLVVQMGKWRRKITLPTINACVDNPLDKAYTHLPRNRFDGDGNTADIPKIAIASGSADPFECMLLKAGIDPAEIDVPSKNTRIQYYKFNGKDRDPGGAPAGTTLTSSLATLKSYDVVILPCEGGEKNHNADAVNVAAYADAGGRVFATHYSYSWLATPSPTNVANNMTEFYGTANWALDNGGYADPTAALIDTTFPKGDAFATWLQNIGATPTFGQMSISEPRHDANSAISPPSQRWMYGWKKNTSHTLDSDMLLSMTFNTPVAAATTMQCGRVVFSDFHVSAAALVSGSCKNNADCGFGGPTCQGAASGTCAGVQCGVDTDCPSTLFTNAGSCVGAVKSGTCTPDACTVNTDCGNSNCQSNHCECTTGTSQCGSALCGGYCSAKACTVNSDCISSETCSGAVSGSCGAKTCTVDADCGASGVCTAGTCQCTANAACGSGTCSKPPLGTCNNKTCYDTGCGASEQCSGTSGTCTPKTCAGATCGSGKCMDGGSCACTANNQCQGSTTCTLHTYKTCGYKACSVASDCKAAEVCSGGQCVQKPCTVNADCGGSRACVGGKCTCTAAGDCGSGSCITVGDCQANVACSNNACTGNTQSCTGSVQGACLAKTCTTDSQCGGGRCVSGKCTCGVTADCGGGTCTLPPGSCTAKTCTAAATTGCGAAESCSGAAAGACAMKTCTQNSDCPSGLCYAGHCECTKNSTCVSPRTCIGRECVPAACAIEANCGNSEGCIGGTPGTCKKPCTADSDCALGTCSGGFCQGCYSSADCPNGVACSGTLGTCTASSMFPQSCKQGNLSAQEAALEFMLFDLTACVSPDSGQPPVPPVTLNPVTFTLDFSGMCGPTEKLTWRELDWKGVIPSTASIVFSAQTGDAVADFTTARSVTVATATTSTPTVPTDTWDTGFIPFTTVSPAITSKSMLRVTVTLNPTSDKRNSPSLNQWRVVYDCSEST